MRDTKALQAARLVESDPYRRRFVFPKWTRTVTALDEPRLFKRLPEFADWTRERHEAVSRDYLTRWCVGRTIQRDTLQRYISVYGVCSSWISGGFCSHWPDDVKDACRSVALQQTAFIERSYAHWLAAGRRAHTWRALKDARMKEIQ